MNDRFEKMLLAGVPMIFMLALFAVPSLIMLLASFRYPGEFGGLAPMSENRGLTLETYRFFFSDFIYTEVFMKSIAMALLTTVFCLMLAYPLAKLIAKSPKKRRDALVLLVILPFASNFLIRVYAWMILLGPQSVLSEMCNAVLGWFGVAPVQLLFSPFAVLIAMVYAHLPFMVLPLYANLARHDPLLLDAAQDLGANSWQRFWRVTFPLSLPGVYSGSALVFIPALGMFVIPELLGGTRDMLIGNLIKEQFLVARDWPFGSTLAIMLTLSVALIAWLSGRMVKGRRYA